MRTKTMRQHLVAALAAALLPAAAGAAETSDAPPIHRPGPYVFALLDRFEYGDAEAANTYLWDAQARIGGDRHGLWLKTEGEGEAGGAAETAELQALYSRLWTPFWDWQAGVRYDLRPEPDRAFAVLGVQGLAPYRLETDAALFLSDDGDASVRLELEYELLLTQRLILQPRLELDAAAHTVTEYGVGRGLNSTEAGLRLRYEIRREFAPYIGVRRELTHGETRDLARDAGEPTSATALVIGIRAWY